MRKTAIAVSVLIMLCVFLSGVTFAQSLEEIKAQARAQVKREMGITDTTGSDSRYPTKITRQPVDKKLPFDLEFRDLDLESIMQFVIIMLFLGFIPATIAYFKGRNFFLWWLLGVLLFIVAVPVILILKKRTKTQMKTSLTMFIITKLKTLMIPHKVTEKWVTLITKLELPKVE